MIEELIIRALCDTLPQGPVDGAFLFGQTPDNQQSVFSTAQQLLERQITPKVLFTATGPISGYAGFDNWKNALIKLGVAKEKIEAVVPVPENLELLHTRIEAESMVQHAKKYQYKNLIVISAPFQQPRAFMAAVTAALLSYPELNIYSLPGMAMPWQEEVTHSQGEVQGTRAALIAGEMERIRKYNTQGDLASVDEVLAYLNKRDTQLF